MQFDNRVNPHEHYMSLKEACELLGIDRNHLNSLTLRKRIDYDIVAGHRLMYRQSVLAYKDKRDSANKPHNPYAKQEVPNASSNATA